MPDMRTQQDETPLAEEWWHEVLRNAERSLSALTGLVQDKSRRVDEYRVQSLAGETLTIETWQPDYDMFDEIIEAVIVTGPAQPQSGLTNTGTQTSATAGQVIAQVTNIPQGAYQVQWTVQLGGTTSATEANNFALNNGASQVTTSMSGTVSGNTYPQLNEELVVGPNGTVSITAIATATVGAVYRAQLTLIPVGNYGFELKLGKRAWSLELPSSGILVIAPVCINLDRNADRSLTASVPGDWSVELMGYADVRYRYK